MRRGENDMSTRRPDRKSSANLRIDMEKRKAAEENSSRRHVRTECSDQLERVGAFGAMSSDGNLGDSSGSAGTEIGGRRIRGRRVEAKLVGGVLVAFVGEVENFKMRQSPGSSELRQRCEQNTGCSAQISGRMDRQNSFQAGNSRSNRRNFFPDLRSGRRTDGHEPFCLGGQKQVEDKRSLQQRIDGKNDPRRFSTPNDPMGLRKIGHDESDDVVSSDAQLSEHICRLGDAAQPFLMGPSPRPPVLRGR